MRTGAGLVPRVIAAIVALTALAAAATASTPLMPYEAEEGVQYVPDRIIVGFATDVTVTSGVSDEPNVGIVAVNDLNARFGVERMEPLYPTIATSGTAAASLERELGNAYVLTFTSGDDPVDVAASYAQLPEVRYAEPDYIRHTLRTDPNDPYWATSNSWGQGYRDQWDMEIMACPAAWDVQTGSASVVVAVSDTGVDYNHADMAANMWHNPGEVPSNGLDDDGNGKIDDYYGYDFIGNDANPMDDNGHGTHCAGTIGAVGNNSVGISGINWRCGVMAVKGLDSGGSGADSTLAPGIIYAADEGADIISMSWGGTGRSTTIHDALVYAHDVRNCVLVVAGGNSNANITGYKPAWDNYCLTVAASDPADAKCSFSNWGIKTAVAAPGGGPSATCDKYNCLSLRAGVTDLLAGTCGPGVGIVGTNYYRLAGTSMACPHVAGLAALILAQNPGWTNEQVRQAVQMRADDILNPGFDRYSGFGRINAYRSATSLEPMTAFITSPENGGATGGTVTVLGTAAGPNFSSYTLDCGLGYEPASWTTIATSAAPVTGGTLAIWDATSMPTGMYTMRLRTTGTGSVQNAEYRIEFTLTSPVGSGHFTEVFSATSFDLDNCSLRFTPDGSPGFYTMCKDPITILPTDPTGGAALPLTNDNSTAVNLTAGAQVSIYGSLRSAFYVGSNGYVTLDSGDTSPSESTSQHFALKRISALFDDLNPPSGSVTWKQLADRAVVTFLNVPENGTSNQNTFQIEMFFDGRIVISYLAVAASDGLAGISAGGGTPAGFAQSDLSNYGPCVPLHITRPNGGEFYEPGNTVQIQWTAVGGGLHPGDTVRLEFSDNGGISWNPTPIAPSLAYNAGSYDWNTTGLLESSLYRVRVVLNADPSINDGSDSDFAIARDTAPPVITHTQLPGTGDLTGPYEVCGVVTDNLGVGAVTLYWSKNGGAFAPVSMTASGIAGEYCGSIPGPSVIGDRYCYFIEAADVAASPNTARSPATGEHCFEIIPCITDTIGTATTASTAAAYQRGNAFACTSPRLITQIEHYLNPSASTELRFFVYESTTLTGTYNRIHETAVPSSGTGLKWYSSGPVSVLLIPGRYYIIGAAWQGTCTYYYVSGAHPVNTAFGQSRGGYSASVYPPKASITYSSTSTTAYHQRMTTCKIGRLLTLARPNGGERYEPGNSVHIQWTSTGPDWLPADTVALEYSTNGGTSWDAMPGAAGLPYDAAAFNWDTTGLPDSSQYKVRVVFNGDTSINDGSDSTLTIACDTTPPAITHTPLTDTGNMSGPYGICALVTDNLGVANVTLHYSKNGGAFSSLPMTASGTPNQYCADIPGPSVVGDQYCYYIEATDSSICAPNTTRNPATGENCFDVIDCRPPAPTNPSPADGATGVPVNANLSWTGALAMGAESLANPHWLVVGASTTNINEAAAVLGAIVTTTTDFSTASLTDIDVVIFGMDISAGCFTRDAATKAKLAAYVSSGGGLYVEVGGDTAYMDFSWVPNDGVVSTTPVNNPGSDLVSIADAGHPIAAGVTDVGLDNWSISSHGDFTSTGGSGVVFTNTNTTRPVLIAGSYGSGGVVYANIDPTYSHSGNAATQDLVLRNCLQFAAGGGAHSITYDVYMGDSCGSLTKVASDLGQPAYDPPTALRELGTYYWKVVAKNDCGATEGPCWSFTTASDTTPPTIVHAPLADTGNLTGPYNVCATVTDNLGVGAVTLYWNKNGSAFAPVPMTASGTPNQYCAGIPGPSAIGDRYCYHIEATDLATSPNTARAPASGEICFSMIDRLQMLSYIQYADTTAGAEYQNTLAAITAGCPFTNTELTDYTTLETALVGKSVLLVPEQEKSNLSQMQNIGAAWRTTLEAFLARGGRIIVCDYTGGSYGILTGASLMSITGITDITNLNAYVSDPTSPIAVGVTTPYTALSGSVKYTTTETGTVVRAADEKPIVIVKAVSAGHVILLGHDLFSSNASIRKLTANAVCAVFAGRSLTMAQPNGGEFYEPGQTARIQWVATGADWLPADTVALEHSSNGGASWNPIPGAASLPYNAGSFDWDTTGSLCSSYYRVRVVCNGYPLINDGSDSNFTIACDTAPPVITHTPLTDTGNATGPYEVCSVVTDNLGVGSVTLYWSKNGGAFAPIPMTLSGIPNEYCANIPGPSAIGDGYCYYIEAADSSICVPNIARSPAAGENCFTIIDCKPPAPTNPSPADGATGVLPDTNLSWVGSTSLAAAVYEDGAQHYAQSEYGGGVDSTTVGEDQSQELLDIYPLPVKAQSGGVYGVLENTYSTNDDFAVTHIQSLPGLSASILSWATVAVSTGADLRAAFDAICFTVNPGTTDYANLRAAVAAGGALEEFAALGGTLLLNYAGNVGSQADVAPGGLDYNRDYVHDAETFPSPSHPYITGVGYGGVLLTVAMFSNWLNTDHGTVQALPAASTSLLANSHGVSMAEYPWGSGWVIASSLTIGGSAWGPEHSAQPFDNQLLYAASLAGGATAYDIYMGDSCGSLTKVASDLREPSYDPPAAFDETKTYYWKVVAKNDCGPTEGPCWSFTTAADTIPPIIVHTPLVDTGDKVGPYSICATVTDNLGLSAVTLHWSKNGGAFSSVPMTASGTPNQYCGGIPGPSAAGDRYCYYIEATDVALTPNTARAPATGDYCFSITSCVTDAIGGTSTSSTASKYSRGNSFACTSPRFITQIEHYLNPSSSAELRFFVYESPGVTGTYTKIHETVVPSSGTGLKWYSSGPMTVQLTPGRYYIIGTAWQGSSKYYYTSGVHPVNTAFGQSRGGYSSSTYPPPTTITYSSLSTTAYYQRITTCDIGRLLTITQPNGGERYQPGDAVQIQWTAAGTDWQPADTVAIEYSSDSGATWDPIPGAAGLAYNAGSFNWDTTGVTDSDHYRVRVILNGNPSINDVSNADFTVRNCKPPAPTGPDPADGVWGVSLDADMSWVGVVPATQDAPISLLQNGGFEAGSFAGWTTVTGPGTPYQPWTLASAGSGKWFRNGMPFEGLRFAQNGFDGSASLYYDIYQEVTIPAAAASAQLRWSDRLQWDTTYGATVARPYQVTLQPAGGGAPLATLFSTTIPPATTGDTGYVTHSVDLLAAAPGIAGQTVRIHFHELVPETNTGPAQFDLDGVSLTVVENPQNYSVYMGASCDTMTKVATGLLQPKYDPGHLTMGTTYCWKVVAQNSCGTTEGPCWSFTTEPSTITKPADGASVDVRGAVVSASFPGYFYIEMDTRECGIRAHEPAHGLTVGTRVDVHGVIRTTLDGERYIDVSNITQLESASISPLGMTNSRLGGGDWCCDSATGAGQQGVSTWQRVQSPSGVWEDQWLKSTGLNNIGLLVTIFGKVVASGTDARGTVWFYIDDGSGVRDGTGVTGIYCEAPPEVAVPEVGKNKKITYLSVTGISSCEFYDGSPVNVLRVRDQQDVQTIPIGHQVSALEAAVQAVGVRPRDVPKPK